MPKRRSNERGGSRILEERPLRRHLYLVLDDWSRGYTVRKIDLLLDPVASYSGRLTSICGGFLGKRRLPPPIIRVDAARGLPKHLVASGQHLMFMQPNDRWKEEPTFKFFPILDVATRSTIFCRLPIDFPNNLSIDFSSDPIYMPAGGSIYILDGNCFFVLTPSSPFGSLSSSLVPADLQKLSMLPNPPFQRKHLVSYTYHSHTLFFTARLDDNVFIFTFNTIEGRWYQKATFMVPFQMHFDPVLVAFVGLCKFPGSIGHICITYMDGSWKLSKEKLFSKDIPAEKQVGYTLVYMGGRSNFCLVECISHDHKKCHNKDVSVHSCRLFRLTPFFLKYDKNGDLHIVSLQVQYYNVPKGVTESALNNPAAFWM